MYDARGLCLSTLLMVLWVATSLPATAQEAPSDRATTPTPIPFLFEQEPPSSLAGTPERPRLVVVVTFDHFRADYLSRFQDQFGPDGFRRLIREGYWARDCRYRNGVTTSAPGHAVLATGAYPDRTGILGDARFDPDLGRLVQSVEDPSARLVAGRGVQAGRSGASPRGLRVPTLADQLRAATADRGLVVALSMTESAAVVLGGFAPHRALWWDPQTVQFVSSTYYTQSLDPWVLLFNDNLRIRNYAGVEWTMLKPESWYSLSRRDEAPYEIGFLGQSFPYRVVPEGIDSLPLIYQRLTSTPLGDDILLELAERSLGAERLGADPVPDLLSLSFGASTVISRGFGPFSREAQDLVLRTDDLLARLLALLDRRVGKGAYTVVVAGSGGVAPIPEALREKGTPAGRISPRALMEGAERHLRARFPTDLDADRHPFLAAFASSWVWLNQESIRLRGLDREEVRTVLRDYLASQRGIATAYTADQLEEGRFPADDSAARAFSLDLVPGRSGDVVVLSRPNWIISPAPVGTASGTPYAYDQDVVLLLYGKGIVRGIESTEPVGAEDVVPTLAALLAIDSPPCASGTILPGALTSLPVAASDPVP